MILYVFHDSTHIMCRNCVNYAQIERLNLIPKTCERNHFNIIRAAVNLEITYSRGFGYQLKERAF